MSEDAVENPGRNKTSSWSGCSKYNNLTKEYSAESVSSGILAQFNQGKQRVGPH